MRLTDLIVIICPLLILRSAVAKIHYAAAYLSEFFLERERVTESTDL